MIQVNYYENDEREQLDRILCALEDAIDMIRKHDADRDIEVSGFIFPDGHGSLIIHLGECS